MATRKTTTKKEVYYLAKWNKRIDGRVEKVGVKCTKDGDSYKAVDGTPIPSWATITKL